MKQTNDSTNRTATMLTILIMLLMCGAQAAFAQTSAFTYQGRFTDSTAAQPTNGIYTMTFRLYDQATGGNQIPDSSTAETSTVSVVNGIFTTRLDFGAQAFNPLLTTSGARYLEIQVGSTILTPRQEITATPFANRAANAAAADGLSDNCVSCVLNAQINSVDGSKITGTVANAANADNATNATNAVNADNAANAVNATNAATAQNSERLGGSAASNFVQTDSSAFVRNQTAQQTADFNVSGTGSIGGNVGIGTTATQTEALRVVGSNGGNGGGAGEGISLQAGTGGESRFSNGGAGAVVLLQSGNGGGLPDSNINGGDGAGITLQSAGGGGADSRGGAGAGISLRAGNGGFAPNAGGAGADISIQAGSGGGANNYGGSGGSITLQPGTGGNTRFGPGATGNVLLSPGSGNVGIGTTNPTSKLSVNGDLTVTGTINGTLNTTNFIRNQTAQQTANFNVSGSGTVGGNLTVNGTLNATLGQGAATVDGTNGLTVTNTNSNFILVPGLTQTINVPADTFPVIVISTDGGIRSLSTTSDGKSIVEVAIYVDGRNLSTRQHHLSNISIIPAIVNWALSKSILLAPGSHTIEVRARSTSAGFESNAIVSGNDVLRGQLTVTTIKR